MDYRSGNMGSLDKKGDGGPADKIVKLRVRVRVKVKVKSQKSKLDPELGSVMGWPTTTNHHHPPPGNFF